MGKKYFPGGDFVTAKVSTAHSKIWMNMGYLRVLLKVHNRVWNMGQRLIYGKTNGYKYGSNLGAF